MTRSNACSNYCRPGVGQVRKERWSEERWSEERWRGGEVEVVRERVVWSVTTPRLHDYLIGDADPFGVPMDVVPTSFGYHNRCNEEIQDVSYKMCQV
jgi:hypothetical protein